MSILKAEASPERAAQILDFIAKEGDGGELEIEDLAGLYEKLPDASERIRRAGESGRVLITASGFSLNGPAWDRAHPES